MKLRNKQTGKVQTLDFAVISDDSARDGELASLNSHIFIFRSIKQLNEDYEDYAPTEPLIKDEKIRKVVRAWAEANKIEYVHYNLECNELNDLARNGISFNAPILERKLLVDRDYTIAELCGEEEE